MHAAHLSPLLTAAVRQLWQLRQLADVLVLLTSFCGCCLLACMLQLPIYPFQLSLQSCGSAVVRPGSCPGGSAVVRPGSCPGGRCKVHTGRCKDPCDILVNLSNRTEPLTSTTQLLSPPLPTSGRTEIRRALASCCAFDTVKATQCGTLCPLHTPH
jgi:hypothetical protein